MLKRKFYEMLKDWKENKNKECLLVNGARQIGKTFIIDLFGRENYGNYFYLNLYKNPEYSEIFEGSLEPDEIYKRMSLFIPEFHLKDKDTLVFIDEIQRCKKARTALKFLAIDNRYDFIASGSLLGIHYNQNLDDEEVESEISIPVGYEREVEMFSLDFEEFLWAKGKSPEAINNLREYFDSKKKVPDEINQTYQNLFREYLVVGGMPEVVNKFLETGNFQDVHQVQKKIFNSYEDDIWHYAKNIDRPKIKACYYSIPRQLAKEYTKFQYKVIEKTGSAKKYGNSIEWLEDSGLVKLLKNVSLPEMPLVAYEQMENFKIYTTDIGLTTAMFGFETQAALVKNQLTGHAKGGIYENLIFDVLNKRGFVLHYYKKTDNSQEIEFLFEKDGKVVPVEVKSKGGETVSLNNFLEKYPDCFAYKLVDGNVGVVDKKIVLPHYMVMFI